MEEIANISFALQILMTASPVIKFHGRKAGHHSKSLAAAAITNLERDLHGREGTVQPSTVSLYLSPASFGWLFRLC